MFNENGFHNSFDWANHGTLGRLRLLLNSQNVLTIKDSSSTHLKPHLLVYDRCIMSHETRTFTPYPAFTSSTYTTNNTSPAVLTLKPSHRHSFYYLAHTLRLRLSIDEAFCTLSGLSPAAPLRFLPFSLRLTTTILSISAHHVASRLLSTYPKRYISWTKVQ